jgi:tetratricopeptide (TPR) repeat protein
VIALGARPHAFDAAIQTLKFVTKSNESVVDSQVVTEELRHAIAVVENFATEENIQMAHSHFVLEAAQALKAMARANECVMFDAAATSDLQRAIAYLEQYAGRDHIEVSRCLALLSRRFRLEQNNESAVRVAREALRIAQLHGQRSADLAIALNALGMALIDAGNLVDGMNHLRDSFEMMERINDWNEPFADVSFLYGRQLLRLGRFGDANRCLTIASRIYERRLVPEHRRRINALVLLGRSFAGIGELHEARRRFHQASLDAERLRREPSYLREDADEEEFANVCLSLVNANAEIGDFDESDRLLDIVCEISSDLIGREVGDVRNEYEYKDEAEDAVEEINERGWRIAHLAGPAEVISLLRKDAKDRALELTRWLLQEGDWVCNLGVDDPPYPVGHLHEVLSFALLRVNDRMGAVEAIAKAVHACQCERSIDEIRLAELLNVQGYVLRESEQEEAASSCEERALTIYQRIGHMRARL